MQNVKYHLMNTAAVLLFSYVSATTVTHIYRFSMEPTFAPSKSQARQQAAAKRAPSFEEYGSIVSSGFFKVAHVPSGMTVGSAAEAAAATDLRLMGTISGSDPIARALIRKKSEPETKIYRLRENVFGYTLVRILSSKVHLRMGREMLILDMFAPEEEAQQAQQPSKSGANGKVQQSLSRSFLQQKVLKNMDNALKGLRAGPYRIDGKVEGYRIITVRPYNILYKLGARNGDIIKRVNGHPIDSTEKLYRLWNSIQGESQVTVDLERNNKLMTYEFSISD